MVKTSVPALLAGLTAAAIWGGMYVVSKVVLDVIPPFALLTLRLSLGFASLSLVVFFRGGFHITKRQFATSFAIGFVGYAISLGFQFVGTKLSTASMGALVTSSTPVLVLPFAAFILKERITLRRLLALFSATIGVLAVLSPWNATPDTTSTLLVGNIFLTIAAATWALYSVLVRAVSRDIDVLTGSAVMFLGGIPTSFIFGAREVVISGIGTIDGGIVAGVLFLGIVSTACAMFLWNYAFTKLPASTASLTFFAQPVVGTLLGWAFLGDKITPLFLLGGFFIGLGIIVVRKE